MITATVRPVEAGAGRFANESSHLTSYARRSARHCSGETIDGAFRHRSSLTDPVPAMGGERWTIPSAELACFPLKMATSCCSEGLQRAVIVFLLSQCPVRELGRYPLGGFTAICRQESDFDRVLMELPAGVMFNSVEPDINEVLSRDAGENGNEVGDIGDERVSRSARRHPERVKFGFKCLTHVRPAYQDPKSGKLRRRHFFEPFGNAKRDGTPTDHQFVSRRVDGGKPLRGGANTNAGTLHNGGVRNLAEADRRGEDILGNCWPIAVFRRFRHQSVHRSKYAVFVTNNVMYVIT